MKKQLLVFAFSVALLLNPFTVDADTTPGLRTTIRVEKKELRQNFKEKMQDLKDQLKDKLQNIKSQVAKLVGAEITAISGTTLTIGKDGKAYTVNTDSNTHIQRHYWGKSSLEEFSVGNKVNVHGKFTDEAKTTILAKMIRNLSIMKRHGVFHGDVTAKNSDNFVIDSKQRGSQTVYFSSSTKFEKRNEEVMTYADLQVGHKVRIKGLWDKTLNQITETVQVKDYNLPPKPTKSGSPTSTVIPTSVPSPTPSPTATP